VAKLLKQSQRKQTLLAFSTTLPLLLRPQLPSSNYHEQGAFTLHFFLSQLLRLLIHCAILTSLHLSSSHLTSWVDDQSVQASSSLQHHTTVLLRHSSAGAESPAPTPPPVDTIPRLLCVPILQSASLSRVHYLNSMLHGSLPKAIVAHLRPKQVNPTTYHRLSMLM
jgi:hypothetical protein